MSTTKKVLIAIFSVILIAAFAFLIVWGVINFNKVKEGMSGSGLYTKDDVDNAYNDGYNTALTDKGEYDELINSYRDTITMQTDVISQLNSEKTTLTNANTNYQGQISKLTEHRDNLQAQVDALNVVKANNEESIMNLNNQIADLQNQVIALQGNINTNETQIAQLNAQIESLQMLNEQLQANNELNLQTISGLNGQIANLNEQIEHLHTQIQTNLSTVTTLNTRITELQNSVGYYEQYIAKLETDDKVLVTFEFAGSVYNLQLIEKGSKVSVPDPTLTEYLVFNGWTVDNSPIDLSTFVVTERVRIIADVTYRFVVKFMVENEVKSTQIVEQGQYAQEPSKPRKTGYSFEYWTYGESQVFFDQFPITQNTTFIAKFTRLYDVSFVYEGTTLTTRRVKENATTTPYAITSTEYKVFNGWRVNGIMVDVAKYKIAEDTVFIADITYKLKATFIVDGETYNTQAVNVNGCAYLPTTPSKIGYAFKGWKVQNTDSIIDVTKYPITQDTVFEAIFEKQGYNVVFMKDSTQISNSFVNGGLKPSYPSDPTKTGYAFCGWSIDGTSIVDESNYVITGNTTFRAVFAEPYGLFNESNRLIMTWQKMLDDGYLSVNNNVLTCGTNGDRTELKGKIIVPSGIVSLSDTFDACLYLTEVELPSTVTEINANSFRNCKKLKYCHSYNVKIIRDGAFEGCSSLLCVPYFNPITKVYSQTVMSIGSNVFKGCTSLTEVSLLGSSTLGTAIFSNSFANCTSLKYVYFSEKSSLNLYSVSGTMKDMAAPFYGCSKDLKIYCANSSFDSGSSDNRYVPYVARGEQCTLTKGVSYDSYKKIAGL